MKLEKQNLLIHILKKGRKWEFIKDWTHVDCSLSLSSLSKKSRIAQFG